MPDEETGRTGEPHDEPGTTSEIARVLAGIRQPLGAIAAATMGLFLLALFYTLYTGREFFLPLTVAFILSFLLAPAVRGLKRIGVPPPVGAAVILIGFLIAVGLLVWRAWTPAMDWLERAPRSVAEVQEQLRSLREPVEAIREAGEQVEAIALGEDQQGPQPDAEAPSEPSLGAALLDRATRFLLGGTVAFFLLYFLLALDDLFLRKLVGVLPRMSQRRKALTMVRTTERDLSHYVAVRTITNIGFGIAVGTGLWLVGMPSAILWGTLAGVLNYVPYLGGLVGYLIITFAALTTFETTGSALAASSVYLLLNIIEGNVVTPAIFGRELTLNPVMIFIWLIFWGWIWGIPGALLAVPLLAMTKIIADNVGLLSPLGTFLSR